MFVKSFIEGVRVEVAKAMFRELLRGEDSSADDCPSECRHANEETGAHSSKGRMQHSDVVIFEKHNQA